MDRPVLIYVSKWGCPACERFTPEWERIMKELGDRAYFAKFDCFNPQTGHRRPPGPLAPYSPWFPSILVTSLDSYLKCFTPDGEVKSESCKLDARVANAVETASGYEHSGDPYTASGIVRWFDRITRTTS